MAKAKKSVELMGRAEQAKQELLARLKSDEPISQERIRSFVLRVRAVAEGGKNEMLMGRFPCELCTDRWAGRSTWRSRDGRRR